MAHRSGPVTLPIMQTVVKLLALLSVMPWDVMVEFLQQLRAGRVDRSRWPVALQEAMAAMNNPCDAPSKRTVRR